MYVNENILWGKNHKENGVCGWYGVGRRGAVAGEMAVLAAAETAFDAIARCP